MELATIGMASCSQICVLQVSEPVRPARDRGGHLRGIYVAIGGHAKEQGGTACCGDTYADAQEMRNA